MEVVKKGDYTFNLSATSPCVLFVDNKQVIMMALNLSLDMFQIIVAPNGGAESTDPITLESGYHKVTFIWKAPQVMMILICGLPGAEIVRFQPDEGNSFVQVVYTGPDTGGEEGNVMGYHFALDLDAKGKVEAKRNVQPGFGCLFYYMAPQDGYSSSSTPTPGN